MSFVSHPLILPNSIEERRYQTAMSRNCLKEDMLIILPTGLGKTVVALMVIANYIEKGNKVLLMAPTKPLVEQHASFFRSVLENVKIGIINGMMKPETRFGTISENDLIISTPQCIANDLECERYGMNGFGLVIYDEAHRGTGNYAYVTVARHCGPEIRSVGFTASPGSDMNKIEEVCMGLGFTGIDIRNDDDPDVAPYVHDTYVNKVYVNMPEELITVINHLKKIRDRYFNELVHLHLADRNWPVSTKHMLTVGESLQKRLARGEKTATVFRGLTVQSMCVKMLHAINLAETQGMSALRTYMTKINENAESIKSSKGSKELVSRKEYLDAWNIVRDTKTEHPKISKVMSLVSQILNSKEGTKVMVFTQYRDTCDLIENKLSAIPTAKVAKLIGQSNGGLKQKEQMGILDDFRNGVYNVVVSTSVGEEGLDIASTDAVIFYEPVPSEIRTIQRRGRTGRKNDGEVFVLIAKGTLDEVFEESSKKKEDNMRARLMSLNGTLKDNVRRTRNNGQTTIGEF